ncbi:MAG: hypothetical protein U0670_00895 [Anaerolineae bacterium]
MRCARAGGGTGVRTPTTLKVSNVRRPVYPATYTISDTANDSEVAAGTLDPLTSGHQSPWL